VLFDVISFQTGHYTRSYSWISHVTSSRVEVKLSTTRGALIKFH